MKTSRLNEMAAMACRYFIYLALALMFVLLILSGSFAGRLSL